MKNSIQGRRHRLSKHDAETYRVDDGEMSIFISRKNRHARYKRGINHWIDALADQYRLNSAAVTPGGVFIDCGANIGELGLWASRNNMVYHAFEPEGREAKSCDLNNFQGEPKTNRCGLWFEEGELKFYSKAGSADSSLIQIADYDRIDVVKTTTLDQYIRTHNISEIEVLKIEAEGAEPEVLRGGQEALRISRFVTIDCGRERGLEKADTILEVCNALYQSGFQMIDSDMLRFTLLFEQQITRARRVA